MVLSGGIPPPPPWQKPCSATSAATISHLRYLFSTHGLAESIVTNNASIFVGVELKEFMNRNGINHCTSAPYNPASNGLAERAVQTFKRAMKKQEGGTLEAKLARFVLQYHITPHATTGSSPAKLLMGRELRNHLNLLHPALSFIVRNAQECQKRYHDRHARSREFQAGDQLFARSWYRSLGARTSAP